MNERFSKLMDRCKELDPFLIIKMKVELMDRLDLRNLDKKFWPISGPLKGKNFEPVMANSVRILNRIFSGSVTRSIPVIPVLSVPLFMTSLGD